MRGFALVTFCAILTLSSCATYTGVTTETCVAAGKTLISTKAECEEAALSVNPPEDNDGFIEVYDNIEASAGPAGCHYSCEYGGCAVRFNPNLDSTDTCVASDW